MSHCRTAAAVGVLALSSLTAGCTAGRTEVWSVATRHANEYFESDGRTDRTLAFRRLGPPGAPLTVVLLHGLAQSKYAMRDVARGLSGDYQVLIIDLLGHGDSDKPIDSDAGLYAMARQGRRIVDLVDREVDAGRIDRVVLAGLSYGGGVALEAARLFFEGAGPNPVAGVAVLAPGCYLWDYWDSAEYDKERLFLQGSVLLPWATALAHDLVFEITILERSHWRKDRISEEDRREIRHQYRSIAARVAAARATLDMADELHARGTAPRFHTVTCPMLCLYGEFDDYVAPSVIAALRRDQADNPGFDYRLIEDAGHDLAGEKRYEVISALRAFCSPLETAVP